MDNRSSRSPSFGGSPIKLPTFGALIAAPSFAGPSHTPGRQLTREEKREARRKGDREAPAFAPPTQLTFVRTERTQVIATTSRIPAVKSRIPSPIKARPSQAVQPIAGPSRLPAPVKSASPAKRKAVDPPSASPPRKAAKSAATASPRRAVHPSPRSILPQALTPLPDAIDETVEDVEVEEAPTVSSVAKGKRRAVEKPDTSASTAASTSMSARSANASRSTAASTSSKKPAAAPAKRRKLSPPPLSPPAEPSDHEHDIDRMFDSPPPKPPPKAAKAKPKPKAPSKAAAATAARKAKASAAAVESAPTPPTSEDDKPAPVKKPPAKPRAKATKSAPPIKRVKTATPVAPAEPDNAFALGIVWGAMQSTIQEHLDDNESEIGSAFLDIARERFERMHDTSSQADPTERLTHIREKTERRRVRLENVQQERKKVMRQLKDEERSWAQGRQRAKAIRKYHDLATELSAASLRWAGDAEDDDDSAKPHPLLAPLHLEAALSQANVSLGPGSLMSRFRTMLPDPLLEDDERFRWPS